MKKIFIFMLVIIGVFFWASNEVSSAAEVTEENSELIQVTPENTNTIGSAETLLLEYLSDKGFNYTIDSDEFSNYVRDQIMNDSDKELLSMPEYDSMYVYMSEYLNSLEDYLFEFGTISGFSMEPRANELINDILVNTSIENQLMVDEENIQRPMTRVGKWGSLKLSKAKAYAKKHYKTRNSAYKNFSGSGGNCTNFVSQILVASGGIQTAPSDWKKKAEVFGTKNYWYAKKDGNKFKTTSSFVRVADLYSYWNFVSKTFSAKDWKKSIAYAAEGDIIQYQNKAGSWYHTGFIYRKNSSNLFVSMNNSDYLERKVSDSITTSKAIRVIKTYMN